MKNMARLFTVLVFSVLLSACGGGHEEPKLAITNIGDLNARGRAVVVMSSGSTIMATYGMLLEGGLNTTWSPKGKDIAFDFKNMLMTTAHNTKETPRIGDLAPGTYNLLSFDYTSSNVKTSNSAGMRGLPLATFTLKAGEVIYLGNIRVHTVAKVFGGTKDFDLIIENHEARARAWLAKQSPELASQMKTRLITVSPLFKAMKKIAAKQK